MQYPIDNILIVPSKQDFMNEIGVIVTVYTQTPTRLLKAPFGCAQEVFVAIQYGLIFTGVCSRQ